MPLASILRYPRPMTAAELDNALSNIETLDLPEFDNDAILVRLSRKATSKSSKPSSKPSSNKSSSKPPTREYNKYGRKGKRRDGREQTDGGVSADIVPNPDAALSSDSTPTAYIEPWNRLPDETDRAWELFFAFREMGPSRSITAVAKKFGIGTSTIHAKYSARFNWKDRVNSYDVESDRLYQLQRRKAIIEMADGHAQQIVDALGAISAPFEALARKKESNPDEFWDGLASTPTPKLLDMAIKSSRVIPPLMSAERLSRGMPTELIEHTGQVNHNVRVFDRNEIAEILAVMDGAGGLALGESNSGSTEIADAEVIEVYTE